MIRPFRGRIYDPCCGSGGMFVQSDLFLKEHGGRIDDLSIYGQESNPTTWKLFKMNLTLRRISANIGPENADTFSRDLHPDLRADYVIANPPFNISDWGQPGLVEDPRWAFGVPPENNANFAWVQHIIHHLNNNGVAGIVLANGSLSSQINGEDVIRESIIKSNLVDCIVALPSQLFYNTAIQACLWFLSKNKTKNKRGEEILFIDCSNMGAMISRKQRELTNQDLEKISNTYRSWLGDSDSKDDYVDQIGFCKSASIMDVARNHFVLTPISYVGFEDLNEDSISFDRKMTQLTAVLKEQIANDELLKQKLRDSLGGLGYDI